MCNTLLPAILYVGGTLDVELRPEVLARCIETRCDRCRVPVRAIEETLNNARALGHQTRRRLDILCGECFSTQTAKLDQLMVVRVSRSREEENATEEDRPTRVVLKRIDD